MKHRGREHTSLTETATEVVRILKRLPNIKMIAPGEIKTTNQRGASMKYVTVAYTTAGFELIITGQSVQRVAVHTQTPKSVIRQLKAHKRLTAFVWKERERKPGI